MFGGFVVRFPQAGTWSWLGPAAVMAYEGDFLSAGTRAASYYGIPTGIPNLYRGNNIGYSMATNYATSLGNRVMLNLAFSRDAFEGWELLTLNQGIRGSITLWEYNRFKTAIERMYGPKDDDPMKNDAYGDQDVSELEGAAFEEGGKGSGDPRLVGSSPTHGSQDGNLTLEFGAGWAVLIGGGAYIVAEPDGDVFLVLEGQVGLDASIGKARLPISGSVSEGGGLEEGLHWGFAVHKGGVGVHSQVPLAPFFSGGNYRRNTSVTFGPGITAAMKVRYYMKVFSID